MERAAVVVGMLLSLVRLLLERAAVVGATVVGMLLSSVRLLLERAAVVGATVVGEAVVDSAVVRATVAGATFVGVSPSMLAELPSLVQLVAYGAN